MEPDTRRTAEGLYHRRLARAHECEHLARMHETSGDGASALQWREEAAREYEAAHRMREALGGTPA